MVIRLMTQITDAELEMWNKLFWVEQNSNVVKNIQLLVVVCIVEGESGSI